MSTEPQWGRVLQKNLDHISPSVAGVGKAMGELEKSISFVDRQTQRYVNTIQSLHKAFSGVAITAQLKVYEDYAAILDKNNKRTLVYGQSIEGLENRYNKLSRATNLSVREIGELNAIAAHSIIGRKDFSAIDSQIKRINQYSASVKEVHENFVNLLQIQQKYGVGFKGGGGGGMLRNLTTSELSSMPNEMFFSAAQDAFLGDKKRDTGTYKDLSRFQENRKKFENDYIDSLKQTSGTLFNISDKMKTFGEWSGLGQNTPGVATGTGLVGGMVGALALPTMWSLGKRFLGGARGAAAGANAAAGALGGGGGGNSYLDLMSGAGQGATGNTNIPPGSGTTLWGNTKNAFSNRFSRGNLGRMGAAGAIGLLASPVIDWAAPKLGVEQESADKTKSVLRYAAGGAMAGSLLGPIGTGIGAAAGGLYGVYKNYGAGSKNKKNDVTESERLTQLENEISKELSAHELNYGRINELVTKYNGLVKGTGQELNENLAVVTSLKDQIDNIAVVQNRINDILQRQASSYQELSQAYGDGLRMGKESEEFARKGLKSQELQLQIDRDFFRQKMELQQQLEARIQQGDESAIAQQKEEQVLMERKYKINFNQQDILAKNLEIQGKLAQIQNTRIDLDTRATDIQEQNVDVIVQQARTWTSISQSMKMGVLPEASAILNQVAAVNEKVKVQEQGYLNIQKHLAGVNAEIMQLQRGGLDTVQKQEQLHLKMAERNKLQIKGEQQVNKILESRADQLSSLLTLREKAVSALPEVAMMGGQYEMSMDVGLETGAALFRSDANQFVGTSAGRFGMTTPGGGVGHGGGFMMGRGPGVYAMNQPLALGAMPSQGTMGAAAQTGITYDDNIEIVGRRERMPPGTRMNIAAKSGEVVIPERFLKNGVNPLEHMSQKDLKRLLPFLEGMSEKTLNRYKGYGNYPYVLNEMLEKRHQISSVARTYAPEGEYIKHLIEKDKISSISSKASKASKISMLGQVLGGARYSTRGSYKDHGFYGGVADVAGTLAYATPGMAKAAASVEFANELMGNPIDNFFQMLGYKMERNFNPELKGVNTLQTAARDNGKKYIRPWIGNDAYSKTSDSMSSAKRIRMFNEMLDRNKGQSYDTDLNKRTYGRFDKPGLRQSKDRQGSIDFEKNRNQNLSKVPEYNYSELGYSGENNMKNVDIFNRYSPFLDSRMTEKSTIATQHGYAALENQRLIAGGGSMSLTSGLRHDSGYKADASGQMVHVKLDDSGSLTAVVSSNNANNSIMRQNNFVNANQRDGGNGI